MMRDLAPYLFPDLILLYVFPNGLNLHVRLKELAEGEEMVDVIRFLSRLYGKPSLHDPKTRTYLGPERRRYNREAA